jgi:predicted short-subunit dehydrogenase-like oxidoreductase (DUF2520 family)
LKIGIVGTGKVAQALAKGLKVHGLAIFSVFGRNSKACKAFAAELDAVALDQMVFEREDLVILAVSDDALSVVAKEVKLKKGAWLVHTCGSKGLEVFEGIEHHGVGVFYPLQSFSLGRKVNWSSVRFLIETQDFYLKLILESMAERLGAMDCLEMDLPSRLRLHTAAVFASNFTNFMLIYAHDILKQTDISFDMLKPLVFETFQKAFDLGAAEAQTGPARRFDQKTIQNHSKLLGEKEKEIYQYLSALIQDYFRNER